MMLGKKEIIKQYRKGNIFIEPYNRNNINPNSIDVRMGNWIIEPKTNSSNISLSDSESTSMIWEEPRQLKGIGIFVLEPHSILLTHTLEKIGSSKYATLLKARSTIARCGLDICASAGFGDVGYINHWTLEITNNSNNYIELSPGMRIAQIAFIETKNPTIYKGAYVQTSYWKPEDMLPVLGHDRVFLMWLVLAMIKAEPNQKFEELAPESISLVSIAMFSKHFGYCPIYAKKEKAIKYFPDSVMVKLPIEEVEK